MKLCLSGKREFHLFYVKIRQRGQKHKLRAINGVCILPMFYKCNTLRLLEFQFFSPLVSYFLYVKTII